MTKLRSKRKGTIKAGGRSNYYITINRERKSPFAEVEKRFRETMKVPLSQATDIGEADVVVGVPFYSEADTLGYVLETASLGLKEFYPDSRSVIVTAGSPSGSEALKSVTTPAHQKIDQIAFLMEDELLDGKGWSVRAIVEIADRLGADLVILEADLLSRTINGEREGLSPDWIKFLLEPIRKHEADLVISRFNFHHYDGYICKDLAYPLLTALYNQPIPCLLGGQWGIAHSLLRTYLNDTSYAWHADISGYGVDSWLATDAITNGATIWEADLGVKIHRTSGAKADLVLKQVANALFHQIVNHTNWWSKTCDADGLPVQKPLPIVGLQQRKQPDAVEIDLQLLLEKYRNGIYDYQTLYEKVLTQEIYQQLLDLGEIDEEGFNFSSNLWARIIYEFLLAYAFGKGIAKGDLLNSLSPLHDGFTASKVLSMHRLERKLSFLPHEESERLLSLEAQQRTEELVTIFLIQRNGFLDKWREKSVSIEPPLPRVTYREFIPGIPLIVPSEIIGRKGNLVTANGIYDSIFTRHKERFEHYVYEQLHIPREANSLEMSLRIKDYLHTVERHIIPEADLRTVEGTRDAIQTIFNQFPHGKGFALTPEAASHLLGKCPPLALPAKLGHKDLNELLQEYDPCSLLALANWTEEKDYVKVLWETIADEIQPEHFAPRTISFVAVRHEEFPSLVELRNSSSLDKLTATILVSNLHKGMGGWFPKLRYFLAITRDIVEAERFGEIWQNFAARKKDFSRKVIHSLEGHWGREPLSAHNIYEDGIQQRLAERLRQMAKNTLPISAEVTTGPTLSSHLSTIADSYPLALALPDGHFVTCSAWSWSTYAFKGGRASPPPLSLQVERDWASREFLVEYFKAIGGTEEEVEEKIIELIEQGREWENLAPILLGTEKEATRIVPAKTIATAPQPPFARDLVRYKGNPILEPVKEHPWESRYVLNAGAVRLEGSVYLIYRAFGEDQISRLGLAISQDGFEFNQRIAEPIFEPVGKHDAEGCEDPRLTLIGNRLYMTYVVFDGTLAQIALASIEIRDFTAYRWGKWQRHGLVFPGCLDKDGALFPELFEGKYAMLHRVDPHIWITFSSHLHCPWSRKEHKILAGSTSGMMWDGHKIGAGSQPIKTKYGWLLITHGVDHNRVYRLGIMLLDLADPAKLVYRSPNSVLEPADELELGKEGKSWKSNVVFTCGAVTMEDGKELLEAGDQVIIYYGAADSSICAATAQVGHLVPKDYR